MADATTAPLGKAKHWCLTVNNYGDADICQFKNIEESAAYYIYGKEVGDSGTRHLQCYIVFKTAKSYAACRKIWPTGYFTHKYPKSTPQQAADYCRKDGDVVEFGELPEAQQTAGGRKTSENWALIKTLAQEGKLEQIPPKVFVGCFSNLVKIQNAFQGPVSNLKKPCGLWIYGKAGAGKSFKARTDYPEAYIKMMNKWWDNYAGEEVVILEDFDLSYSTSMHYFLKIWADAYAFRGEMKGTSRMMRPKKFVITSQYTPAQIWNGPDLEAVARRFKLLEIVDSSIKKMVRSFGEQEENFQKRKATLEKMNEVIKKPKMVHQDAVVQTQVKYDFTEKGKDQLGIFAEENAYAEKKSKPILINPLDAIVQAISISDSDSDHSITDPELEEWSTSDEYSDSDSSSESSCY